MSKRTMTRRNIEAMRVERQSALDAERSAKARNQWGQFSTPFTLAADITRSVLDDYVPTRTDVVFADPACGTGSFFSALLDQLGRRRLSAAIGIELDERFASAASELWSEEGLRVVQGDFTRRTDLTPRPNLVLTNPPYIRHHHLPAEEKRRLQAEVYRLTGIRVSGLAGLYVYFLILATEWMEEDGVAAWLIPSEFLDVNYGRGLRDYLRQRVSLLRLHQFDPADVQFADALVTSTVVVFRKTKPAVDQPVRFTRGGSLSTATEATAASTATLEGVRWSGVVSGDQGSDAGLKLGDLFRISRGIATGANAFFILPRTEAMAKGLPDDCLRPILPSPRNLHETVVQAGPDGYPLIENPLSLLDTDLAEDVIRRQFPRLAEYLDSATDAGVRGRYLVTKRRPWYKQEAREAPLFLCTYMGRGTDEDRPFRFIWNKSAAIATNMYLFLYPRPELSKAISIHPRRTQNLFTGLEEISGEEQRRKGRVYGGGLHKIEPKELASVSADSLLRSCPWLESISALLLLPSSHQLQFVSS